MWTSYWRERDNDADGLIGWQESASVKVLGFPPGLHRRGAMNLSFWTAIGYSAAERDSFISKALCVSLDGRYDLTAESIPSLISTLRDGPKPLVLAAATALNQLGPLARSAEPALRDQLRNPDGEVRSAAAYALKKIGAEEQATLDALILALTDESGKALGSVANALGSFGPRAAPSLPHLIPLIASRYSWQPLRWSVAQIGSAAVPPLTAALRSDDPWVRESAADILGKIGSDASPALLVLRDLTKENPKRGVYARVISDIE